MDTSNRSEYRKNTPAEQRLEHAIERLLNHANRKKLNWKQRQHLRGWTIEAAHAVFELNPDLREEHSLIRYFIGKQGRKNGLHGRDLTEFIENEYRAGTWYKHVPEEVLKDASKSKKEKI